MLRCCNAVKLPNVIVSTATPPRIGAHTSASGSNATKQTCSNPAIPAALEATDRNAVTGRGEPS